MDFDTLLDNIYDEMHWESEGRFELVLPQLNIKRGTTKMVWSNVKELLKLIQRSPDHFIAWLNKDLQKSVSWNSKSLSDGLTIHSVMRVDEIKGSIIKYINKYVICESCKKANSQLVKDKTMKKDINRFECINCGFNKYTD